MRVLHLTILLFGFAYSHEYTVPHPKFKLLSPRGFSVSIPEEHGIQLFAFHGNINKEMPNKGTGIINGDVVKKSHGKWIYKNKTAKIQEGDVVNYWVFVLKHGKGYIGSVQSYTFKAEDFKEIHRKPIYHHKIMKRYAYRNIFPNNDDDDYNDDNVYPHIYKNMKPYSHKYHSYHGHHHGNPGYHGPYHFEKQWPYENGVTYGMQNTYGYHHHPCGFNHKHSDRETTTEGVTRPATKLTTTTTKQTTTTIPSTTVPSTTIPTTVFPLIDVRIG